MGEQVGNFDRSTFLVAAELDGGKAAVMQAALDRAMRARTSADRVTLPSGTFWRLGDAAQAAVQDGFFYAAIGGSGSTPPAVEPAPSPRGNRKKQPGPPQAAQLGPLGAALLPAPGAATLSATLQKAEARGFDKSSAQLFWVDLAGIVRSLQAAAESQGEAAALGTRLLADRAAGLRDALLELRAGGDGAEGELHLRFPAR